jgi:phosphatidylglycerophosphate synthase
VRGRRLRTIADRLTLLRLLSVPLVWALALLGRESLLAITLAAATATDVVDGPLARRSGVPSAHGAQLDSVADLLLIVSAAAFLVLLRPAFVAERKVLLGLWALLCLAALLIGWFKFRRVANLHLYAAKAAGVVGWVFVVWILLLDSYPPPLFYAAVGLGILAALDAVAVQLVRRHVDEHVKSVLVTLRRRSR